MFGAIAKKEVLFNRYRTRARRQRLASLILCVARRINDCTELILSSFATHEEEGLHPQRPPQSDANRSLPEVVPTLLLFASQAQSTFPDDALYKFSLQESDRVHSIKSTIADGPYR